MYGPPLSDSDDDYDGFSFGDPIEKIYDREVPPDKDSLFQNVIEEDDLNKFVELLSDNDINRPVCGSTLLGLACREGRLEIVKYLLDKKAQPNIRENSLTPLMEACANQSQGPHVVQIVEMLLDAGALINVPDNYGTTAFMFACKNGHSDVVRLLIKDVSIEASDQDGWTPIFHAIENNRASIVALLIDHGFDVTITDKRGYTPRQVAESHGFNDIAEMLPKEKEPPYRVPMKYLSYNDIHDIIPRVFLKSEYPEYFQEINSILLNMGLDYLLEHFEKGNVSLADFLTISEKRLQEIGIELPLNRAKLQKAVLCFHLHHWTKRSIAWVRKHSSENFYDILVLAANHVQNLVIINSSLHYVKNNLVEKNFGNVSTETIQSLRENLKNYRVAIKRLQMITKQYNSFSPSRSPLYISYPDYLAKRRNDKIRKWLRYTIFVGVTAVICLKVNKIF